MVAGGAERYYSSDTGDPNSNGGSGGYNTGYVNVTPKTTYTITVGAGGKKVINSVYATNATDGKSGFVLIAYGGDI